MGIKKNKGQFGKLFEKTIVQDCRKLNITCIQIPDKFVGVYNPNMKFAKQVKTPFDFVASVNGKAIFFDAKFIDKPNLNIKTYIMHPKKSHQFFELYNAYEQGSKAGYLVFFKPLMTVTWFPIHVLDEVIHIDNQKSVSPDTLGAVNQRAYDTIDLGKLCFLQDFEDLNAQSLTDH